MWILSVNSSGFHTPFDHTCQSVFKALFAWSDFAMFEEFMQFFGRNSSGSLVLSLCHTSLYEAYSQHWCLKRSIQALAYLLQDIQTCFAPIERRNTKATLMRKPHVTATITINVPLNITVPIVSKTPEKENTHQCSEIACYISLWFKKKYRTILQ